MQPTHGPHTLNLREKLLTYGAQSLSDIELLAVFISSGSRQRSCLQLAHDACTHLGNLRNLLTTDLQTFREIPGLGTVRYTQLQAAHEISRRSDFISLQKDTQLMNTKQTHTYLKRRLRDKKNETFAALFLDNQYRVIAYEELFHGTIDATYIHARPIIERILKHNAAAVVFAHNHPSGHCSASAQDIALTEKLQQLLSLIDAQLLDHLVIGDNSVYSIVQHTEIACH